jgi:DNA-binding transcriptional regulator YhcF (GntR family)
MIEKLKKEFNDEVLQAVEESKKIGYVPTRFIQMLQQADNNAFEVVQRLVTKEATTGLEKLWEKDRLDLSVEALIVQREFQELFPDEIVKICKRKLKQFGYKI